MGDTGLAMQYSPKLKLVSYTSHSHSFLGFYKDVKVVIEGFKTRHPIFIIETRDHNFVLEQSFLNSVKFSQKYKPDKIFDIITYVYLHQLTIFQTLATQNSAN